MSNKAKLKRTVEVDIPLEIDGNELFSLWWQLNEVGQAQFFNRMGEQSKLPFQLQALTDCEALTLDGRSAMTRIGEYAEKN